MTEAFHPIEHPVLGPGPCTRLCVAGVFYIYAKRAAQGIADCEYALALHRKHNRPEADIADRVRERRSREGKQS